MALLLGDGLCRLWQSFDEATPTEILEDLGSVAGWGTLSLLDNVRVKLRDRYYVGQARRHKREVTFSEELLSLTGVPSDPFRRARILKAFTSLPAKQRRLLRTLLEETPTATLAARQGLTTRAVEYQIAAAKEALRAALRVAGVDLDDLG